MTPWLIFPVALALFGIYALLRPLRLELFRPADEPIIFDRKHRKVYRIVRDTQPGLFGLLKPWPIHAMEYDWDLIDAEHNARVFTTGGSVHQQHALVFLVRKSVTDPTIIDSFNIGHAMVLGELTVPCVWEHIRRFMEENGPHLPPGESVNPPEVPASWWQATRAILPVGRGNFRKWLWDELPFAILLVVLSPLFVPMFLIWGTGNWLSHKTARPIAWPDEVVQAVGPALRSRSSGTDS